MTLKEIQDLLDAELICGEACLDVEIAVAGGSDLMSDVLAYGEPGLLLLTGLTNVQTVRTADIIDASAVVYVRGKKPENMAVKLALEKNIPLLSTRHLMYKACGLLYGRGLPGVERPI